MHPHTLAGNPLSPFYDKLAPVTVSVLQASAAWNHASAHFRSRPGVDRFLVKDGVRCCRRSRLLRVRRNGGGHVRPRYSLNNRYLDASTGTFLSADPLVAKTGYPYLYGNGNPVTYSDPAGLEAGSWCDDPRCKNRGSGGVMLKPPGKAILPNIDDAGTLLNYWWNFEMMTAPLDPVIGSSEGAVCVGQDSCIAASNYLGPISNPTSEDIEIAKWLAQNYSNERGNLGAPETQEMKAFVRGMLMGFAMTEADVMAGMNASWRGNATNLAAFEAGAAKVPKSWGPGGPNNKKIGIRWEDPTYKGNGIRIDAGDPSSPFPAQQVDHVVVRSGGSILGPDGVPIVGSLKQNPQAHIPLVDWLTWNSWNSPS